MNTLSLQASLANNPWHLENGKSFSHLSFKEFVDLCEQDRLDELKFLSDLWSKAKQGFGSAYKSWNPDETEEDKNLKAQGKDPYYEKFKAASLSVIEKAKQYYNKFANLGIDPFLVTTLIGAGMAGGPAALPIAALAYWTRKTLMKGVMNVAGSAFDKGVELVGKAGKALAGKPPMPEPVLGHFSDHTNYYRETLINEWVFANNPINYSLHTFLVEEGYTNLTYHEWLSNPDYSVLSEGKVTDWLAGMVGKGFGHIAGMVTSLGKKAYSVLTKGLPDLAKWAYENKLNIAKAAYLMTIGYFIGQGVTKLTNKVIDEAMNAVKAAGAQTGIIPANSADALRREVIPEAPPIEDQSGDFARANQGDISGMADTQKDLNLMKGQEIYDTLAAKAGNFKQQFQSWVQDMNNPDRDAVELMKIAQTKAHVADALDKAKDMGTDYFNSFKAKLSSMLKPNTMTGPQAPEAPAYEAPVYQQPVYQEPQYRGHGPRPLVPGQIGRNIIRRGLNWLPRNR